MGQPRSIKLVDDVVGGDKLVGLVASDQSGAGNRRVPKDLYQVGTIATVHRLLRAPDGTIRLLVQGMDRFRLGEFVQEEPYLKAQHRAGPGDQSKRGWRSTPWRAMPATSSSRSPQMIPSFPEELVGSITSVEDPLQTVYTIANFQRMDLEGCAGDPGARFGRRKAARS